MARTKHASEEKIIYNQVLTKRSMEKEMDGDIDSGMAMITMAHMELDSLRKSDIGELKSFKEPPDAVVKVMTAVLLIFGVPRKQHTWDTCKKICAQSDFLAQCQSYNKKYTEEKERIHLEIKRL